MPFYSPPPTAASFQQTLRSFVQGEGLSFRDVLTEERIQQVATQEQVSFGTGAADVYSVPVTLWAFLSQVASTSKSCVTAVSRVLVLLTILGRRACNAGSGAYCKARAKLSESFLRRLACAIGCAVEDQAAESWRWHHLRVLLLDGSTLSMPDTPANQRACRVRELVVVTTFTDSEAYPQEDILELYHERWNVEIDLRSIKTHMHMEILSCRTPEMVRKEIWAHLLAYNLVRQVMAQAARAHGVTPRQLSFTGALQTLGEFRTLLLAATTADLPALVQQILAAIATHGVGDRPNRSEPRKVKRRPKGYSRMIKSRAEERAELLEV